MKKPAGRPTKQIHFAKPGCYRSNQIRLLIVPLCLLIFVYCGGGGEGDGGDGGPDTSVVMVSSGNSNAGLPQVGLDSNGNGLVVWQEGDVYSNRYTPSAGWSTPTKVSTVPGSGTSDPRIAVNSSGRGVALWVQGDGTHTMIYANRFMPGTGWGSAELISTTTTTVDNPDVAIDGGGNVVAVWDEGGTPPRNIFSNIYQVGSGWGTPTLLSSGTNGAYRPRVAMNAVGRAFVVWQEVDGVVDQIYSRMYTNGQGWDSNRFKLSDIPSTSTGSWARGPEVSTNENGEAAVVWRQTGYLGRLEVYSNRYMNFWAGGGPICWLVNPPATPSAKDCAYPTVVMLESNNILAVFGQDYGGTKIYANYFIRNRSGGASWEFPTQLSNGTGTPQLPKISASLSGNAIAVWEQNDGSARNIYMNEFKSATSTWGNAKLVEFSPADAFSAQIGMNDDGAAIIVWSQNDGVRNSIYAKTIN